MSTPSSSGASPRWQGCTRSKPKPDALAEASLPLLRIDIEAVKRRRLTATEGLGAIRAA
jgi:hypothetical protein